MDDIAAQARASSRMVVHNPVGYPPKVMKKLPANRLDGLDGKTIYLVDCRFDDSIELLKQVQAWFGKHMPSVKTKIVSLNHFYGTDDPATWEEIKANGHAASVRTARFTEQSSEDFFKCLDWLWTPIEPPSMLSALSP